MHSKNHLYPYIWTHPFWHLWASWFFAVLLINKKPPINCVEDQPFNIPTKCGSNWFSEFRELDLNYGPLWRRWTPSDVNTRCCQTSHLFRRRGARYLLPTDVNKSAVPSWCYYLIGFTEFCLKYSSIFH